MRISVSQTLHHTFYIYLSKYIHNHDNQSYKVYSRDNFTAVTNLNTTIYASTPTNNKVKTKVPLNICAHAFTHALTHTHTLARMHTHTPHTCNQWQRFLKKQEGKL